MIEFLVATIQLQIPYDKLFEWSITVSSTLAGVVVGSYLTYFFQTKGSLRFYMNNLEWQYDSKENTLDPITLERAYSATMIFTLEIVNSKLVSQNIRNIKLKLTNNKSSISMNIKDMSELKNRAGREGGFENLSIANIPPNSIQQFDLRLYIDNKNISILKSDQLQIFITYNNHKNNQKSKKIYSRPMIN